MTDSGESLDAAVPGVADDGSGPRGIVVLAVALVVGGVAAMVFPGLMRDGICGLLSCADVTPEVGVGRPSGAELAVVIPQEAAGELRSLRLFPRAGTTLPDLSDATDEEVATATAEARRQEEKGVWLIFRTEDSSPTSIVIGSEPDGFDTRTELEVEPVDGSWVVEASFGCSSSSVRFSPPELTPGLVTSGGEPVPNTEFAEDAQTELRCSTDAPAWQRWLFVLGALSTAAGALIGIVVMFRRPPRNDASWYGAPED